MALEHHAKVDCRLNLELLNHIESNVLKVLLFSNKTCKIL